MNSGGWIEQYEIEIDANTDDNSELPGSEIRYLSDLKAEMALVSGRDFQISSKMKQLIEEAGFVDVQEQKVKLPLGPWASDSKMKDLGRFFERFYKTGLQGWLMHICTRLLGVSERRSERRAATVTDHPHRKPQTRSTHPAPKHFRRSIPASNTTIFHC
jgi:hypothetical protein